MIEHPKLKVKLDSILPKHVDDLFDWRNDPEIFKWCRQRDLLDYNNHLKWYESLTGNKSIKMYLVRNQSDQPIGVCGLTDIDLYNQRAEFSLYIASIYQKSGLGTDALKLLLYHGFKTYPLNVIWGETFLGNGALTTFKKIGFTIEGTRRDFYFKGGRHIDAILVSIKRNEFTV